MSRRETQKTPYCREDRCSSCRRPIHRYQHAQRTSPARLDYCSFCWALYFARPWVDSGGVVRAAVRLR